MFMVNLQNCHIVVVDDSSADRQLIKFAVEGNADLAFHPVAKGPDLFGTIGKLVAEEPQGHLVVFLDLQLMPYRGVDLLKQLRETYPLESLPVICMSSTSDPESWESAYQAGANAFWAKPMDLDQLDREVSRMIRFFNHQLAGETTGLLAAITAKAEQPEKNEEEPLTGLEPATC